MRLTVLGSQGTWPRRGARMLRLPAARRRVHAVAGRRHRHVRRLQEHLAGRRPRRPVDLPRPRRPLPRHHPVLLRPPLRRAGRAGPAVLLPAGIHRPGGAARVRGRAQRDGARPTTSRTRAPAAMFEVGPFRVTPYEMTHIGVPVARVSGSRPTARCSPTPATPGRATTAVELARGADLFLCRGHLSERLRAGVLPPERAAGGGACRPGGVARLVLTHITPNLDPGRVAANRRRSGTRGSIDVGGHRHGDRGRRVTRPDGRGAGRPAAGRARARLPGVGRGLGPALDGQDPRARAPRRPTTRLGGCGEPARAGSLPSTRCCRRPRRCGRRAR